MLSYYIPGIIRIRVAVMSIRTIEIYNRVAIMIDGGEYICVRGGVRTSI